MKKYHKIFVLLCLVFMALGLTRCESDAEVSSSSFEIVSLEQLSPAIQDKITVTADVLKTSYTSKSDDKAFGIGITDKIHQRQKENGTTSYTLALMQKDEGLYYDNLVINEAANGSLNTHIVRYQPEASWFYKHKNEGWGYETYSGTITIYTETGNIVSSVDFTSGQPQKNHAKTVTDKANKAGNCEIIDIQEAGLLQGEIFYVYEITITVDCSGDGIGGGGFGDGGINNGPGEEGGAGGPGGHNGNGAQPIDTVPIDGSDEEEKVCVNSFVFTDVGENWQNAGLSDVNVQFVTIGGIIGLQNVHFPELHFGLPKSMLSGEYITNNNARYVAQEIMTQAEELTNSYQSNNPTSTALELKNYFLARMQELASNHGGTVGTTSPLGWNGTLQPHQTYFVSQSWECD